MTASSNFSTATVVLAALVALATTACDRDDASSESQQPTATGSATQSSNAAPADDGMPPNLEPGQTGTYGAPISDSSDPMSLADALDACAGTSTPCVVRAEVDKSCQSMGCWLTMKAPGVDTVIRVKMLDYGFFVPANAADCVATFEGTLEQITLTQAQAQHYADDEAGQDGEARTVTGPESAWEWTITGIELTHPQVL